MCVAHDPELWILVVGAELVVSLVSVASFIHNLAVKSAMSQRFAAAERAPRQPWLWFVFECLEERHIVSHAFNESQTSWHDSSLFPGCRRMQRFEVEKHFLEAVQ